MKKLQSKLIIDTPQGSRKFVGQGVGVPSTMTGELVFNTSMSGYQEILTDPSYMGQIVLMTHPHIGNTGVNVEDNESKKVWVNGFIAKSFSVENYSSWRADDTLTNFINKDQSIPMMEYVDTRAITRCVREHGACRAVLSTEAHDDDYLLKLLYNSSGMQGKSLAYQACSSSIYKYCDGDRAKINVIDCGCKTNIPEILKHLGCEVTIVPIIAPTSDWVFNCDAILISNGPGDPASLHEAIEKLRGILGVKPITGICMGHQLISLALGAQTYKLPFGHRGSNHPIKDHATGKVTISSQNHGFCVERESLISAGAVVTHTNLNDNTVAGFAHYDKKCAGVQYHPEAKPGPEENYRIMEEFLTFAGV